MSLNTGLLRCESLQWTSWREVSSLTGFKDSSAEISLRGRNSVQHDWSDRLHHTEPTLNHLCFLSADKMNGRVPQRHTCPYQPLSKSSRCPLMSLSACQWRLWTVSGWVWVPAGSRATQPYHSQVSHCRPVKKHLLCCEKMSIFTFC